MLDRERVVGRIEMSLEVFRAKTTHHFLRFTEYPKVGDKVNVKYDPKSLKVELDLKDDLRYGQQGFKHQQQVERQAAQAQRDALLAEQPGTPPKTEEQ